MDNLDHHHHGHHHGRGYNTHQSVFRPSTANAFIGGNNGGSSANLIGGVGGGEFSGAFGRWRSRSSPPPVARRLQQPTSTAAATAAADAYDDDPHGRPRTNFHSSFHDLHLANEARASRHDLSQLREEVLRGFRGPASSSAHAHHHHHQDISSRRSFRSKWPLPPPPETSPSCRRCSEMGGRF